MTDKGVGKPPLAYLAAVENGFREHGKDIHAMGTNALRFTLIMYLFIVNTPFVYH